MNQYIFGSVRVSALTPRLLRVEYHSEGAFVDAPTQIIWSREFKTIKCAFEETRGRLYVITEACVFIVSAKGKVCSIALEDGRVVRSFKKGNLKGTRRTLDGTFGRVKLSAGLISLNGVAVLDDSGSLLLSDDKETILPRGNKGSDRYYFAYGRDYRACLRDFYQLAGAVPMIPRFALGNWWSRYYAYTQQEYLNLMDRFAQENIPLTVATIDMDWHWVDLKRFGDLARREGGGRKALWHSGWTGYSWNTDLFPDYRQFLKDLKARNLKVTVNLHPADGVRPFEDAYGNMAKAVGINPASREQIPFDLTEKVNRDAYFEHLHRPYQREGVDFWWIDWQQGKKSRLPGLDPLWALNHYHYRESAANAPQAALILSRYAGLGSHRYPLGFSGDTAINWRVLKFQPYFTANAANAGYGWWSHDIGGHHFGKKDAELYIRWLQFGVFNPIMRLHSTSNEFGGKEPWKYGGEAQRLAGEYMRLRHRLIPYLYSMAARAHQDGIALCEPLYYAYPNEPEAYAHENLYFFGSELIAAPVTSKIDPVTMRSKVSLWLPAGRWTDIFTGQAYEGGKTHAVYRTIEHIPVFAKAGAIIPMNPPGSDNNSDSPAALYLDIWRGDNAFTLYEDEGETVFTVKEDGNELLFSISPGRRRDYVVTFKDIEAEPAALNQVDGAELHVKIVPKQSKPRKEALVDLITSFEMGSNRKKGIYTKWLSDPLGLGVPGPRRCRGAIEEILDTNT